MLFNAICEKSSCITVDFVVNYKCCENEMVLWYESWLLYR